MAAAPSSDRPPEPAGIAAAGSEQPLPTVTALAPGARHDVNDSLANELINIIDTKLMELGIRQFWDTANLARNAVQTQRNMLMKLPALARARCLQVILAHLEAIPIPEGLRHRCSDPQVAGCVAREFRMAAELLSERVQLQTWLSCGQQLFACADPMRLIDSTSPDLGLNPDHPLARQMQDMPLATWPTWYELQYDALGLHPLEKVMNLEKDENNPARVWREGRVKDIGFEVYPQGVAGAQVAAPKKKQYGRAFPRGWSLGWVVGSLRTSFCTLRPKQRALMASGRSSDRGCQASQQPTPKIPLHCLSLSWSAIMRAATTTCPRQSRSTSTGCMA